MSNPTHQSHMEICLHRPAAGGRAVLSVLKSDPPCIVPPSAIRSAASELHGTVGFLLESHSTSVIEACIHSSILSAMPTLVPL